jgi:hypothetical protein
MVAQRRSQRRGYQSSRSRRTIDRLTSTDHHLTPKFCPLPVFGVNEALEAIRGDDQLARRLDEH